MVFNTLMMLCNHHLGLVPEHSINPKETLFPSAITLVPLPSPSPLTSFPSADEPGLAVSHTGTHTPCGLVCLVPSLSVVGSGSVPGAASLLLVAEGYSRVRGTRCVYLFIHEWTFVLFLPFGYCE